MIFSRTWSGSDRVLTGVVSLLIGAAQVSLALFSGQFAPSSFEFRTLVSGGTLQLAAGLWWLLGRRVFGGNDRVGTGLFVASFGIGVVYLGALAIQELSVSSLRLGVVVAGIAIVIGGLVFSADGAFGGPAGRVLRSAAMKLGFEIKPRFLQRPAATGTLDLSEVTLTGNGDSIQVQARSKIHQALVLELEASARRPDRIQTGDEEFDAEIHVGGDAGQALAILTRKVRDRVLAALRTGCTVRGGAVHVERKGEYDVVVSSAHLAAELALCLERSENVPADLRRNARAEAPGVRLANLRRLLQLVLFSGTEKAEQNAAAREAIHDEDDRVRSVGAQYVLDSSWATDEERAKAQPAIGSGRLSIAASDGGAVSLAQEAGALSVTPKKRTLAGE